MKKSVVKTTGSENQESRDEIDWERKQDVTIEEVKTTKDMEHLTDEQVGEVTGFIKTFSMLLYNLFANGKKRASEKDAKVISLQHKKKNKRAA